MGSMGRAPSGAEGYIGCITVSAGQFLLPLARNAFRLSADELALMRVGSLAVASSDSFGLLRREWTKTGPAWNSTYRRQSNSDLARLWFWATLEPVHLEAA